MGTSLKENRNSWLARVIVVVLALTFIVGLGYTGGVPWGGVASGVAVRINGDSVPLSYYRQIRRQVYASRTEDLDKVPVEVQDAIDRISLALVVQRKLLAQKAHSLGFRVADGDVAAVIKSDPSFHLDGVFAGPEYYRQVVVRGMGISLKSFEETIRDEALASRLLALAQVSSVLSEREFANLFDVSGERIRVEYISFEKPEDAQNALAELFSSRDIGYVAEKFGKKTEKTPFFTRFGTASYGGNVAEAFTLQPSSPFVKRVFSSDGIYYVAAVSERKKEEPATLRRKIRIAMRDSGREKQDVLNSWVGRLYAKAEVETGRDLPVR